ncbi:hypothetical protein PSY40_23080, partial [Shigella flexneri]|nr:hypothetical protein [Shigella flexneri]
MTESSAAMVLTQTLQQKTLSSDRVFCCNVCVNTIAGVITSYSYISQTLSGGIWEINEGRGKNPGKVVAK